MRESDKDEWKDVSVICMIVIGCLFVIMAILLVPFIDVG